jgi:hypothetical protein
MSEDDVRYMMQETELQIEEEEDDYQPDEQQ